MSAFPSFFIIYILIICVTNLLIGCQYETSCEMPVDVYHEIERCDQYRYNQQIEDAPWRITHPPQADV